jgi:hypothetical protein
MKSGRDAKRNRCDIIDMGRGELRKRVVYDKLI